MSSGTKKQWFRGSDSEGQLPREPLWTGGLCQNLVIGFADGLLLICLLEAPLSAAKNEIV